MPDVRERLRGMAVEPVGSAQEQFGAFLKSETAMWVKALVDNPGRLYDVVSYLPTNRYTPK